MALVALDPAGARLVSSLDADADSVPVICPDAKCGAKLHHVSPRWVDDVIVRCAHFRHSVGSGCPWGSSHGGGDRTTPWHVTWQMTADDLARIEVVVERGESTSRADTVTKDGTTAIEYQHSALDQATITRRENVWRGHVVWVIDAASTDRADEARIRGDRFYWDSTPGLNMRLFRGVVLVDIGNDQLVELPRTGALPSGRSMDIPAAAITIWTRQDFIDTVVNGDSVPFDFTRTLWAIEARAAAAKTTANPDRQHAADSVERRELAREKKLARQLAGESCEYGGDHRDRLTMPADIEPVDVSDAPTVVKTRKPVLTPWAGHPCRGCGELGQAKAQAWCERCWQTRIESMVPPPLSVAERRALKGTQPPTNPRSDVVAAIADLDREARGG